MNKEKPTPLYKPNDYIYYYVEDELCTGIIERMVVLNSISGTQFLYSVTRLNVEGSIDSVLEVDTLSASFQSMILNMS